MSEPFSTNAQAFIAALRSAGAHVVIKSTYRPSNRAFLMHWSWKITRSEAHPQRIPVREGVNIRWDHEDDEGHYSHEKSVAAAQAMVREYETGHSQLPPALTTKHTEGNAVDLTISWNGNLTIRNRDGTESIITSIPRSGMNKALKIVGATYGVIKFRGGSRDKPHWSDTGA